MKLGTTALAAAAMAVTSFAAQATDEVTLQLKWVTQAQFAGYYVAQEQGFYDEEDLNVTIKAGGPDIAPPQVLAGGGADVMLNWMPSALAAREKGLPVVNIAQPFKTSGLMLTCWKDTGITSVADFKGKTIGVQVSTTHQNYAQKQHENWNSRSSTSRLMETDREHSQPRKTANT